MHEAIQSDFEIGAAFRERLVPHAVVRARPCLEWRMDHSYDEIDAALFAAVVYGRGGR